MKISVITVNWKNLDGLRKTIDSIASQTVQPYEFIVIDGGSADGTVELLRASVGVVTDWVSEKDNGIYHAMNKGVSRAHGDWCIFMNSGDCFSSPSVIECVVASGATADIICGNVLIQENPVRRKTPPAEVSFDFLFNGTLCHQSALIRTSLLRLHPYDESLRIVSDRKFFLQVLVFDNCSYEAVNIDIADYDVTGFSAQNRDFSEQEWQQVLAESIPQRIRDDYVRFQYGDGHRDDDYDRFYLKLRNYRSGSFIYSLNVLLLRALSIFKKSARFARSFPLHNR